MGEEKSQLQVGREYALLFALALYGLLTAFVFKLELQGLASTPSPLLHAGASYDAGILFLKKLQSHSFLFWVFLGVFPFVFFVRKMFSTSGHRFFDFLGDLHESSNLPRKLPVLLNIFAVLIILSWPFLWAWSHGLNSEKIPYLFSYLAVEEVKDKDERVQRLKSLTNKIPGSSYLFLSLFNSQRERILEQCGGVGDKNWTSKRSCLLLLYAVGIESLEQVRPAFLAESASRAALLLSLDGITRILSQEGMGSPHLNYFINSLDLVGLSAEKEDLLKILEMKASSSEVLSALQALRRRVEERLEFRQTELNTPDNLRLKVPGPLEAGV